MNHRVQVISLDKTSSSTIELLDQLRLQGIDASVFSAIDGRSSVPELEPGEIVDQNLSIKKRFVPLTNTEIACYLSHFRAIKCAYKRGLTTLCLLEDDVLIEPNFSKILSQLTLLDERYELVRLMGLKRHKFKVLDQLDETTRLVRPVKGLCGAQGYVINRKGMEQVLKNGSRMHEPIDKFYDHFWENNLRCYAVVNHVIWERPSPSTVIKQSRKKSARGFRLKFSYHSQKFIRSVKRSLYILKHRNEFHPAIKSPKNLGRTTRIH